MALWQANRVRDALMQAFGFEADDVVIEVISTSGDRIQDRPLREVGGKGLFVKELEQALLEGAIDFAVHSLKDVETQLPEGLQIGAVLPREDVRDALIAPGADSIDALPKGAVIGTSSLRRQAQLKRLRPDLEVVNMRGNVETRLDKIARGEVDATLLAMAGLKRLGLKGEASAVLEPEVMLPAVGQGAIAVEIRNDAMIAFLNQLIDSDSDWETFAEREMLAALGGSCHTPVGGLARISGDRLHLRGLLLAPDGSAAFAVERQGPYEEAEAMGRDAGEELRAQAGEDFMARLE